MIKKFVSNSLDNLIAQVVNLLAGMVSGILIARGLGVESRGIVAALILIPATISALVASGFGAPIVHFIAAKIWPKDQIFSRVWGLTIILLIPMFILAGLAYIFRTIITPDSSALVVALVLLLLPIHLIRQSIDSVFTAFRDFKSIKNIVLYSSILNIFIVVSLFMLNLLSVQTVILVHILNALLGLVLAFLYLKNLNIEVYRRPDYSKEALLPAVKYGAKGHVANLASFFNYKLDQWMVVAMLGGAPLGLYVIAVGLAEKLWILSSNLSSIILPMASESNGQNTMAIFTSHVAKIVLYIQFIGLLFLFILGRNILILLYGIEYEGAFDALMCLLVGIVALGFGRILANYISGIGKPEVNARGSVYTLIVNLVFNILLIPPYGIVGAAIASSVSYTFSTIYIVYHFLRLTDAKFSDLFLIKKSEMAKSAIFIKKRFSRLS